MTDDLIVIEPGEVFSRARHDPRKARLNEILDQLFAPCNAKTDSNAMLVDKLYGKASMIGLHLESLAFQQEVFEHNAKSIEEQIERAQNRWNELPDVNLGLMPTIDKVRQHILSEKQNLMQELRQLRTAHAEHRQRTLDALVEAFADYCSTLRALSALENRSWSAPALTDLLDFIPRTSEGDEVIVQIPPRVLSAGGARLP